MAFNLANERIQDTYEQLVQISGSTLLNGIGTAIPAITNINSVSSSYAITASYAEYAVSASYEIVKEVSSSHADMADTASYAVYAVSAGSATTSTSASYAVTASYAANATIPTLQQVTDTGASSSNNILMTNPNGNQTITFTGLTNLVLRGAADYGTTFDPSGLFGAEVVEGGIISGSWGSVYRNGANILQIDAQAGNKLGRLSSNNFTALQWQATNTNVGHLLASVPITGSIISASSGFIGNLTGTATTASYIDPTFISASAAASGFGGGGGGATPTLQQVSEVGNVTNLPITASGFSGNGSGLTNINTAFGAELYFNAADYVIDIPGDANDAAYTVSISQSGVYLISASKVPPYAANGPRVNLQWCPQQLGSGVAKVKFFIPSLDTGTGITYKQSVSCSADYQYIWNSTTSPSSSTSSTIARSLTLPQYSNGSAVTNMIKGGDGYVYFSSAGTPVPSQGYIYTGPSIGLLV